MSRILLVHGEPDILGSLINALISAGHDVETRTSGQEALRRMAEQPSDLVLLDCSLSQEGGFESLKRIRELPSAQETAVLCLAAPQDEDRCLEAGATDCIPKPWNGTLAMHRIRMQLEALETRRRQKRLIESLETAVNRRGVELAALHRRLELINDSKDLTIKLIVREISAPATGIAGIARLALLDEPDTAKKERLTDLLNRNVEAMDSLLANAEHLSALKSAAALQDSRPTEILPVLEAAAVLERKRFEERKLTLAIQPTPEPCLFPIRRELLSQMLLPLVRMSALFAESGSSVAISFDSAPGEVSLAISWSGERQNQGIVASVSDLGNAVIQDLAAAGLMSEIFLTEKIARIFGGTVVWDLRNRGNSNCTLLFSKPRER